MAKRVRYYAVVSGNPDGIFNTWEGGAAPATQGVSNSKYKSYATLELAVEWYRRNVPQDCRYPSPVYHFDTNDVGPAPTGEASQASLDGMASGTHVVFTICNPETNEPLYVGETKNLERSVHRHLGAAGRKRNGISARIAALLAQGIRPVFQAVERYDTKEDALAGKSRLVKQYVQRGLALCNRTLEHREIQELYLKPVVRLDTTIGDGPFFLGSYHYSSRASLKCGLRAYLNRVPPGDLSNQIAVEKLTLLWAATSPEVEAFGFSTISTQGGICLLAELVNHTIVEFDYVRAIDLIP
ncbi:MULTISPECIES: ribonuclease H1 domain-containing protein [Pseudomonas]|uniref:Caulimovirus viroplasmin n=1 Tax=Pseudomonas putida TaxID=303 RepID=A0A1B2F499_PSEPU|nr:MULTISPECIES: viroplasmin family protein [Pseudomonas]ANY87088.1 Caulimovirus viroplasmin [Pseudomonas putida]MCL8308625.1 viroplasmin family protein [Pseudomonas putida]